MVVPSAGARRSPTSRPPPGIFNGFSASATAFSSEGAKRIKLLLGLVSRNGRAVGSDAYCIRA